jgi:hypothetical protein
MKRLSPVWAAVLILAISVTAAPAGPISAEKLALSRKMVMLATPTLKITLDRVRTVVKQKCTKPGAMKKIEAVFKQYLDGLAREIALRLSLKSLKAFMAFYQTPVGKKLLGNQVVILNQFVSAMIWLRKQRAQGKKNLSLADAISVKKLDPARYASARDLSIKAKFAQMMAGGAAGAQLARQGITPAMMQEFWARLVARLFSVAEIKKIEVFYKSMHYQEYVRVTPKFQNAARKLGVPLQQRIVRILQNCR